MPVWIATHKVLLMLADPVTKAAALFSDQHPNSLIHVKTALHQFCLFCSALLRPVHDLSRL